MRAFDASIAELLNGECNSEAIHFVGLGLHDFQMSFGKVRRIQSEYKVAFCIRGKTAIWHEAPLAIPVWTLLGQTPLSFVVSDSLILRMNLDSGDHVEFHPDEGPYESLIVELSGKDEAIVMEVY